MNNTSSSNDTTNDRSDFWTDLMRVPDGVGQQLDGFFAYGEDDEFTPSCPVAREARALSTFLLGQEDDYACAQIDGDYYNGVPVAHIRSEALTRIQEGLFAARQLERYLAARKAAFGVDATGYVPADAIPEDALDDEDEGSDDEA
jgi:hypothetical protein